MSTVVEIKPTWAVRRRFVDGKLKDFVVHMSNGSEGGEAPCFVVSASDWLGPDIVRKYSERLRASFGFRSKDLDPVAHHTLWEKVEKQCADLDELAFTMQRWQMANPSEVKFPE